MSSSDPTASTPGRPATPPPPGSVARPGSPGPGGTGATAYGYGWQSPRRLMRERRGRVLAGVAKGTGTYLGISVALVRLAFVLLSFAGGVGVLLYLVAWVVLPEDEVAESAGDTAMRRVSEAPLWVKVLLAVVASLVAVGQLGGGPSSVFWALVLITLGVLLYRQDERAEREGDPSRPAPTAAPAGRASPAGHPGQSAATPVRPSATAPAGFPEPVPGPGAPVPGPAGLTPSGSGWERPPWPQHAWPQPAPAGPWGAPPWPQATHRPPRPRPILGQLTVAAILLATGAAALLRVLGVIDLGAAGFLALVLTVSGLGLIVGAWRGRARGLIVLGTLVLPVLLAVHLLPVPLEGGVGEQLFQPVSLAQVQQEYDLLFGVSLIDLSAVQFEGEPTTVRVSAGAGEVHVIVPADVNVEVRSEVGAGEINVLGEIATGTDLRMTTLGEGSELGGRLELDISAGVGSVLVTRAPQEADTDAAA